MQTVTTVSIPHRRNRLIDCLFNGMIQTTMSLAKITLDIHPLRGPSLRPEMLNGYPSSWCLGAYKTSP